ncbi:hypothetical protein EYZ11_010485 [Aspergillus tanneri]|uniref:Uncharacterized protein n=1 Tax=Aspergillus tanneri TaxID=1220188 RepID=A0A4S3J5J7_9EURO|nr:hypothetical protein EYZ11_010485 [Aspergillus tanneri]
MDLMCVNLLNEGDLSPASVLDSILESTAESQHLDILTDILTVGSEVDERVGAFITAAWDYTCRNSLWSFKYDNLNDYRKAINYVDIVRPIIQKHRRSDRAKHLSLQTILRNWKTSPTSVTPRDLRPTFWSKHLLTLLAKLSKKKSLDESRALLQESVRHRPQRGRSRSQIIASDVQRVLDQLEIGRSGKYTGINSQRNGAREVLTPPSYSCDNNQSHQSNVNDGDSMSCIAESSHISDMQLSSSYPIAPLTPELSPSESASIDTELLEASPPVVSWKATEVLHCDCAPICLPLVAFLSSVKNAISQQLTTALVHWARSVSWGSFCSSHLQRLAVLATGIDIINKDRIDLIGTLESVCQYTCEHSQMIQNITVGDTATPVDTTDPVDLLCRYTGSADAWSDWTRDGILHIPGFFSYMEDLGIFGRIRRILTPYEGKATDDSSSAVQICHDLITQMVQQDPAYYAVLVACRPDKNWKFLHRPRRSRPCCIPNDDDVTISAPSDKVGLLTKGKGVSDLRSTISLPANSCHQTVRLVPGFHRHLLEWLAERIEQPTNDSYRQQYSTNLTYDESSEYRFGCHRDIILHHGDLILTLPQILRWSKTFSANNLLNISQSGLDDNFETLDGGCDGTWTRLAIAGNYHKLSDQYLGANEGWQDSGTFRHGLEDHCRIGSLSAVGEATLGRRQWRDPKVIQERNLILGRDSTTALGHVRQVREHLAAEFHEQLDLLQLGCDITGMPKLCFDRITAENGGRRHSAEYEC